MSDGPGHWFNVSSVTIDMQGPAKQLHVPHSMSKTFDFLIFPVLPELQIQYRLDSGKAGCIT